ncbi:hypothetical protein NE237_011072 [Protea cynaroides]|uniref:Uncharacterized protein n=1 Tax=Protea cynaroides TaxID=273540 RepID=A0A9Q0JVI1_9MAGN|nr:hypothetical protein NE237_011072 [Protea cynaroides]
MDMKSEQDVPWFPHHDQSVHQVQGYAITTAAESHSPSHQRMQNQGRKRHYRAVRQSSWNKQTTLIRDPKKASAVVRFQGSNATLNHPNHPNHLEVKTEMDAVEGSDAVVEEVGDGAPLALDGHDTHDVEGMDEPHESSEMMAGIQAHKRRAESSQSTNDSSPGALELDGRSDVKRNRIQPSPTTSDWPRTERVQWGNNQDPVLSRDALGEAPGGHSEKSNILDDH